MRNLCIKISLPIYTCISRFIGTHARNLEEVKFECNSLTTNKSCKKKRLFSNTAKSAQHYYCEKQLV